ncbi:MAG: branched-chain amino acid transport system [Pseudomonadota bacterium]
MANLLLDVDKISIQFGGLKAVDGFSLQLHKGELAGLIGPNGAGKTTVFNLLTGVYQPTSGSIRLAGTTLNGLKPFEIARMGIARTFQNIRLFKELSVIDNILLGQNHRTHYGLFQTIMLGQQFQAEEANMRAEALELLQIFKLDHKMDHEAGSLPYGEQRKLEILRALATKPKLLFLDEPAAGMNNSETAGLMEVVATLREKFNLTILLIEHDMKFVMNICEKIHVLDHGIKIAEGNPKHIQNHPEVIKAYLGTDEEMH